MSFQIILLHLFIEVDRLGHAWGNTNTILDEARNADELDIDELFSWNVVDTAENILVVDEQIIEDAKAGHARNPKKKRVFCPPQLNGRPS